jgi:hypothetical protein
MDGKRIIEEARETLRRVDRKLSQKELHNSFCEPIESLSDRHRRELAEEEEARRRERRLMGREEREIQELRAASEQSRADLAEGLATINRLAEAFHERIEAQADELSELRTKLQIADARISDLLVARGTNVPPEHKGQVIDLPNPILRRG